MKSHRAPQFKSPPPHTLPQIQTHVRSAVFPVTVQQPFNYKFPEFNFTTNTKLYTHSNIPQLLKINRCWVEPYLKYWRWLNSILEIFSPIKTNVKIVIRELQTSRYHKIKSVWSYLVMLGSLTSYCLKMIRKVISNIVLDWIQVTSELWSPGYDDVRLKSRERAAAACCTQLRVE